MSMILALIARLNSFYYLLIAAEASEPAASERRSNTNLFRWGFLSQNILAQCIVVMRDRKCAVSYFSVVSPRHGNKDILKLTS